MKIYTQKRPSTIVDGLFIRCEEQTSLILGALDKLGYYGNLILNKNFSLRRKHNMVNIWGTLLAMIPLALVLSVWGLGIYALFLLIKVLRIYIDKNSPPKY